MRQRSIFREIFDEDETEQRGRTQPYLEDWQGIAVPSLGVHSAAGLRNLKAARSESWPWAAEQLSSRPPGNKISKRRSEAYIDILHRASLQGFAAPPRHEIQKYQQKPLPLPPSTTRALTSVKFAEDGSDPHSGRRADSFLGLSVAPSNERKRESMLMATEFSRHRSNSNCEATLPAWMSRIQKRAENNQKAHDFHQRRQ